MNLKLFITNLIESFVNNGLNLGGSKLQRHVVEGLFSRLPQVHQANDILNSLEIEMFTPCFIQPDNSEHQTVKRIFNAYKKAKDDQKEQDKVFLPSSLWQRYLDSFFPSYKDVYINQFHFFLSNFGALELSTGFTWTYLIRKYSKTSQRRKYFEKMFIGRKVSWWLMFESNGRDVSTLSHPLHGNLWGAYVNNNFVSYESVLNEFYGSMISNFVEKERPIVGEIGAGYGLLFYFISRAFSDFCYLDFDLPEILSCATYYLGSAEKR